MGDQALYLGLIFSIILLKSLHKFHGKKPNLSKNQTFFTYFSKNTIIFGLKWSTDRKYCKFTSKRFCIWRPASGRQACWYFISLLCNGPLFHNSISSVGFSNIWSKPQRLWSKSSNPRRFSLS